MTSSLGGSLRSSGQKDVNIMRSNAGKTGLEVLCRKSSYIDFAELLRIKIHPASELDFNGQGAIGLGPLTYEAQRGMFVHPTYAVTPQREPLGILDAWMWARKKKDESGSGGG